MKCKITVFLWVISITFSVISQNNTIKMIQQETAFVHLNNTVFFTGEYLYYKGYVLNTQKKSFSKASDILYVELIGEDKSTLFRHKLVLENGQGHSDFFIPNSVASGNYKIVAYTPNMVAANRQFYFQTDIGIINPYSVDQSTIVSTSEEQTVAPQSTNGITKNTTGGFQALALALTKKDYRTREPVQFNIINNSNEMGYGTFSLSVAKKNSVIGPPIVSAINYEEKNTSVFNPVTSTKNTNKKGNIVKGSVVHIDTNTKAQGVDVAISIPGKDFFFDVATTDAKGAFVFVLDPAIEKKKALLQIVGSSFENFKIEMEPELGVAYGDLKFYAITIDTTLQEAILERSVHNQIENAYYSVKPDTIQVSVPPKSFVHFEKNLSYDVEEYVQFSSIEEIFTEYVKFVWTTKDKEGNKVVRVFQRDFSEDSGNLPLLFVDGVFVTNHTNFLAVDTKTLKTITIVQREYQFGTTEYQGVVLLETKEGAYGNFRKEPEYIEISLMVPQSKKSYYQQTYTPKDKERYARIPDYRAQLVWNPNITVKNNLTPVLFYTSDVPGTYEIILEGFTERGQPISITETISVSH